MTTDVDFARQLQAAQAGERWAIEALWREFHPPVLRFLRTLAPGHAEDLASETWLQVATGLQDFDGNERAFRAWIFTVARNRWIDGRRLATRRPPELVGHDFAELTAPDDPAAEVEAVLALEAAIGAVRTLPSDQAEVILLRIVAGLGVDEIADIIHKRPGTVRVLQHRGLRRLAQRLSASPIRPLEKL